MNPKEAALAKAMQKRGWRVYRNGWPDFLVLDGKSSSPKGCAVEFKARGDSLSDDQKEMHKGLALLLVCGGELAHQVDRELAGHVLERRLDPA